MISASGRCCFGSDGAHGRSRTRIFLPVTFVLVRSQGGYVRMWRGVGATIPAFQRERLASWSLRRTPQDGSRSWFRTTLRRLTAGSPHRDGSAGIGVLRAPCPAPHPAPLPAQRGEGARLAEQRWWSNRVLPPAPVVCRTSVQPSACPYWCRRLESNQHVRIFSPAHSPDMLRQRICSGFARPALRVTCPSDRTGALRGLTVDEGVTSNPCAEWCGHR